MLLQGNVALITGAARGLGRSIAEGFAREGATLILVDKDQAALAEAVAALDPAGAAVTAECVDVTDSGAIRQLMERIGANHGRLDVLVNNVGSFLGQIKPLIDYSDDEIDALFAVNLRHVIIATREATALLKRSPAPSIINISSVEGFRGLPNGSPYVAMKSAISGFTKSQAVELGQFGIRVNEIAPDTTSGPDFQPRRLVKSAYREDLNRWIPLGRFGTPDDIAGCALFLASRMSGWVSGTTIHMDGGTLAMGNYYPLPGTEPRRWTTNPVISEDGFGWEPDETGSWDLR